MTTANVNIKKVLFKRGNTVQNDNYTGVFGEVTVDTEAKTLRIHDGSTVGGATVSGTGGGGGNYGNTDVTAYLGRVSGNIIPNANLQYSLGSPTRWWKDLYVGRNTIYLAGVPLSIDDEQNLLINGNIVQGGNVDAVNSNVAVIDANIGAYQRWANTNAATQSTSLSTINANIGAYQTWANTNAAAQSTSLSTINANVSAANAAIVSNYNFLLANAGVAHSEINGLRANITAANSAIASNYSVFIANASAAHSEINSLRANIIASNSVVASQATDINDLRANITAANVVIAGLQTGSGFATTSQLAANVNAANAAIVTANTGMKSYVDAVTTAWTANAATQGAAIAVLQTQTYSNANVIAFVDGGFNITNGPINFTASPPAYSTPGIQWPNGFQSRNYSNTEVAAYLTGAVTTGNLTTGNLTVETNAVVLGNLRVVGTQTTVNATTLSVDDLWITVADGAVQASDANGAGIRIAGALANIAYSSVSDSFVFNKAISVGNIKSGSSNWRFDEAGTILLPPTSTAAIEGADGFDVRIRAIGEDASAKLEYYNGSLTTSAVEANSNDVTINLQGTIWTFGSDGVLTTPGTIKATTFNNINAGQQITIDPDNTNLAYIKVGGFDDGGERVSISNQFTNSAGIYFYTEGGNSFRMYGNQFKFADDTWQTTAWTGTVANLTLGANVVSLDIDGNLTLPNNMNFLACPAIQSTGIIFGDGTFQRTAAGLPDRITDGTQDVYIANGDLIIPHVIKTPPSSYYVATSDTSAEMNWSNSVQDPNTNVYSGVYTSPGGATIENATTNSAGSWISKTWSFDFNGNLTVPGDILPTVDNTQDLGSASMRFRHLYVGPGTVYVGNAAIKTTATGNLILPGLTRAVASSAYAEEVEDTGDQSYSFATVPTVIDNAHYELLTGGQVSSFTPAEYSVDALDNDGYIDGISIDRVNRGVGYANDVASLAEQNMWATEEPDPINNFNISDWFQIPFQVRSRAGESEYDFNTGGTDLGNFSIDGDTLESNQMTIKTNDGDLTIYSDSSVVVKTSNDNQQWTFGGDGSITFPDDTIQTTAYTGGGGTADLGKFKITAGGGYAYLSTVDDNDAEGYGGHNITINPSGEGSAFINIPNNANAELGESLTINSLDSNSSVIIRTDWADPWIFGANGVLTLGGNATISNDNEFRLWSADTDITVYRNGRDGYGVSQNRVKVFADNTQITETTPSGFEIKQGNLVIPNNKRIFFANGTAYSTGSGGGGATGVVVRGVEFPYGEPGDTRGTIADAGEGVLYYCAEDYEAVQAVEYDQEPASENFTKGQTNDMVFTLAVGEDPTLDTLMQSLTLPSTNWQLSQNNATDGYIRDCVADQGDAGHWTFTWQYVSGQDSSSFSQGDEFSLYYTAQPAIWEQIDTKPTTVSDAAPAGTPGAFWYNTEDGRTYVYAFDTWVDADPTVAPAPSYYLGNNLEITDIEESGNKLVILVDFGGEQPGIDSNTIDYIPTATLEANDWIGAGTNDPETYATVTFANGETRLIDGWNTDSYGDSGFLSLATGITISGPDAWPITIRSYDYVYPQAVVNFGDNTLTVDRTGNLLVNGDLVTGSGGDTVDLSNIQGNVVVNNEGSGFVVDAGDLRRVGFMKYSGFEGSFVHTTGTTNSIPFRIGRVSTNDITLANADVFTTEVYVGTNGRVRFGDDDTNTISDPTYQVEIVGNLKTSGNINTLGNVILTSAANLRYANGTSILSGITPNTGDITFSGSDVIGAGTNVTITAVTTDWTFYSNANIVLPANATIKYSNGVSILSGLGGGASTGNIAFTGPVIGLDEGTADAADTYINISPSPEGWAFLQLPNDTSANTINTRLWNGAGNVEIGSGDFSNDSTSYTWKFNKDGNLTLPNGSRIDAMEDGYGIGLTTDRGTILFGNRPEIGQINHFHIMKANPATVDLFLGDDSDFVRLPNTGGVEITSSANSWEFDANGKLTAPGEVYGQFFTLRGANDAGTEIGSLGYGGNVVTVHGTEGFNVETGPVESGPQWQFDTDGNLTLPLGGMISETANTIQIQKNSGDVVVVAGIAGVPTAVNNVSTPSGGWNGAGPSANLATTGGTGTGLRVDVGGFEGGYASTVTIVTPGSGYTVGDSITVVGGESTATFTISGVDDSLNNWRFGTDGSTTFPDHKAVSITGNLTVGNLIVNGNTTTINTQSYTVVDNIIQMADGNPADTLDLGFVAHRTVNSTLQHTGLIRDASTGLWKLFSNVAAQPGTTVDFTGVVYDDLQLDKLYADTIHLTGNAPGTVFGESGDLEGDIHIDDNYLYYCTQDWVASEWTVGWDGATSNTIFLVKGDYPTPQVGWTVTFDIYTFTIDTVADESNWRLTYTGTPYGSAAGGTATLTNPNPASIWKTIPLSAFQTPAYGNANVETYIGANIGAFQTYANATFSTGSGSTYSNTNVAAYLTTATITTTGNVTAANIITTGATSGNISGANYISANVFQVSTGIFWANGTAWSSTGGGTTYSNTNVAAYLTAGNISVGTTGFTVLPNIVAQFTSNVNSYGQVNMQNINSGTDATTEIVATANNGTDTIFFVDMGIAGNTYDNASPNNSLGTIIYANDAYLYAQGNTSANIGGNLAIGTSTAGRAVTIFAGGINNTSNVATFANTGVTVYGNITAANIITTGTYGNISGANVISANTVTVTTYVRTQAVAFAALPTAAAAGAGARAFITDGNTATFGSQVSGSGANAVPVYSNGTNWFVG